MAISCLVGIRPREFRATRRMRISAWKTSGCSRLTRLATNSGSRNMGEPVMTFSIPLCRPATVFCSRVIPVRLRPGTRPATTMAMRTSGWLRLIRMETCSGTNRMEATAVTIFIVRYPPPMAGCWLVKIDPDGNMLWDKSYGGDGSDYLYSAIPATNGGLLLGGGSEFHSSGNKASQPFGGFDYWLVKVDSDGNKLWDQTFGGAADEYIYGLRMDTNGAYLLAGHSDSNISGNKTTAPFGSPDFWLLSVPEPVPAFVPGSLNWSASQFRFQMTGAPGQTNVVETSTNLSSWAPWLTNVTSATGIDQITDPSAQDNSRFYRIRTSLPP